VKISRLFKKENGILQRMPRKHNISSIFPSYKTIREHVPTDIHQQHRDINPSIELHVGTCWSRLAADAAPGGGRWSCWRQLFSSHETSAKALNICSVFNSIQFSLFV